MKKITLGIATAVLTLAMSLGVSAQTNQRNSARLLGNEPRAELSEALKARINSESSKMEGRMRRAANPIKNNHISTKTAALTMTLSNVGNHSVDMSYQLTTGTEYNFFVMPAATFHDWVDRYNNGDTINEIKEDAYYYTDYTSVIKTADFDTTWGGLLPGSEYVACVAVVGDAADTTAYWEFFTTTGQMPSVSVTNLAQSGSSVNFTATLGGGATGYTLNFIPIDLYYDVVNYLYQQYYMYLVYGYITMNDIYNMAYGYSVDTTYTGTTSGAASFDGLKTYSTYWVQAYAFNATDTSDVSYVDEIFISGTDGGTGNATVIATLASTTANSIVANLTFNSEAAFYHRAILTMETFNRYETNYDYTVDSIIPDVTYASLPIAQYDTISGLSADVQYIVVYAAYNQNGEFATLTTAPLGWDSIICTTGGHPDVVISNFTLTDTVATFHADPINGCNAYSIVVYDTFYAEALDRYVRQNIGMTLAQYMQRTGQSLGEVLVNNVPNDAAFKTTGFVAADYTMPLPNGGSYVMFVSSYNQDATTYEFIDSNMYVQKLTCLTPWTIGDTGVATLSLAGFNDINNYHIIGWTFNGNDNNAFTRFSYMTETDFADYYGSDVSEIESELLTHTGYSNYTLVNGHQYTFDTAAAPNSRYFMFAIPFNSIWEPGQMVIDTLQTGGIMPYVEVSIADTRCHEVDFTFTPNSVVQQYTVVFVTEAQYNRLESYMSYGYSLDFLVDYFGYADSNASTIAQTNDGNPFTYTFLGNDGEGINYGQQYFMVIYANDGVYTNLYTVENEDINPYFHEECEGIEEAEASNVSIYPNPATNVVNVKAEAISHIEFYNALGQMVRSERIAADEAAIDLSAMARGIYMMKVYSGNDATTTKLVVE